MLVSFLRLKLILLGGECSDVRLALMGGEPVWMVLMVCSC